MFRSNGMQSAGYYIKWPSNMKQRFQTKRACVMSTSKNNTAEKREKEVLSGRGRGDTNRNEEEWIRVVYFTCIDCICSPLCNDIVFAPTVFRSSFVARRFFLSRQSNLGAHNRKHFQWSLAHNRHQIAEEFEMDTGLSNGENELEKWWKASQTLHIVSILWKLWPATQLWPLNAGISIKILIYLHAIEQ